MNTRKIRKPLLQVSTLFNFSIDTAAKSSATTTSDPTSTTITTITSFVGTINKEVK